MIVADPPILDPIVEPVIEAMWKVGFFRLRGARARGG
jgi:hypothetical protein